MDSPSKVTRQTLIDNGYTNVFKAHMPDIDVCTCIYDTLGYSNDGDAGRPTIQIKHRNTDYDAGYAIMQDIKTLLDDITTGSVVFGYEVTGDIGFLGIDENGRYEWTCNFIAYRTTI
jgi:hypothetical protein